MSFNSHPAFTTSAPKRMLLAWHRLIAQHRRKAYRHVWPILPAAGQPPRDWPGWPEGKQFALVLIHDIKSAAGLNRCHRLMQLEQALGFRSAFHFSPAGNYRVSPVLRDELMANGFEVTLQDFPQRASLSEPCFNSAFLSRNRLVNGDQHKWGRQELGSELNLRDDNHRAELDIQYNVSTFDTDLFAPKQQCSGTAFPFWVARPDGEGQVELPCTMPQDSTLFLLLQEKDASIWIRKLNWLIEYKAMVLLKVQPDLMRFPDETAMPHTYDAAHYINFLKHIQDRHAGMYWHALPSGMARFAANISPKSPRKKPIRVCMITHSFYETDNRVTRYAEALTQRGDEVDVVALGSNGGLPAEETIRGVRLHRCQTRNGKHERTKLDHLWPLVRFLFKTSLWTARRHRQTPYDLIHVHNIPDFMVFAAWYPKLAGTDVLLDIHDIVPELYASKFSTEQNSLAIQLLKKVERASASFADHVILANHLWLEKYTARSAARDKCSVFINHVDPQMFQRRPRSRNDGKLIVLFPGSLHWHQGLDLAINAFKQVTDRLPNAEFHIYGEGSQKPALQKLAQELQLDGKVRFFDPLRICEIADVMANADLGVVPKRADSFGNEAYSTKIMEFMSLGIPVVVSNTKIDRYYFDDSVVRFFESGNTSSLAEAMVELLTEQPLRQQLIRNAFDFVARNNWDLRKQDYLQLVDSLCEAR